MENIDLKNQLSDLKINLDNTQRVIAEKIIVAGKVPQLERDNDDQKIKLKRYEDNSQKLLEELNTLTIDRNQLLNKIDEYAKNPHLSNNTGAKRSTMARPTTFSRSGVNAADITSNKSLMGSGKNIYFRKI